MEPTNNNPATRTWNINNKSPYGDWTKYHPWRAPGFARMKNPCPGNLPPHTDNIDMWVAGGTAWAWWSIGANHGGGYQYRLCPKSKNLTNECFEEMPLEFATENYTIRYSASAGETDVVGAPDVIRKATKVSSGTKPSGSTWRRNPIPGCNCDSVYGYCKNKTCPVVEHGGGSCTQAYEQQKLPSWYDKFVASGGYPCDTGFQFPPPAKGIYGTGAYGFPSRAGGEVSFRIGDELRVPKHEGNYVLQWRWDCDESDQVWSSCADIRVVSSQLV
jgi:hypothetical protein